MIANILLDAVAKDNRFVHAHDLLAEIEALAVHVENDDPRAGQLGEDDGRQADRPGADDEAVFAFDKRRSIDGMTADRERFDERQLFVRKFCRGVKLMGGKDKTFAKAAVGHDAEHFEIRAAIGGAFPAGVAIAAVHVGLDGASIAGLDVGDARSDGKNFDAEFVAGDAGN